MATIPDKGAGRRWTRGRKLAGLLVAGAFVLFLGNEFGVIRLPGTGAIMESAQRAMGRGRRQQAKVDDIPVLAARVTRQDVPVTLDFVGTIQALNTVLVRAQVDGRLTEIAFRDGQDVKKGDVLARIDARIYQAQYDQALAKKAQDGAQLANARLDLERSERLAAANYGSRQQLDTQRATVAQLEALQQLDQAMIDNVRVTLDHATILAPIDGRTGLRAVDAGNVVRASDMSGIVTITQVQPIAALFSMPQQNLRAVNAAAARGPVKTLALEPDNATVLETGEVEVIDNQVDPATGTVRIRAIFANAQKELWPGQFINIRIEVDIDRQALVVPAGAVQRGPNGPFVYVIDEDMKALVRPVAIARQTEQLAVVRSGLDEGARVITSGFMQLTEGARVKAAEAEAQPLAQTAPTPQPRRGQRGEGGRGPAQAAGGGGPVTR